MSDYISREAAIEMLHYNADESCASVVADFESIPAADVEPVRRWIPCSERLPEEIVPVNVVWVNHFPPPYYNKFNDVPQSGVALYLDDNWYWYSSICEDMLAEYGDNELDLVDEWIEITHWKPLPELPEEVLP